MKEAKKLYELAQESQKNDFTDNGGDIYSGKVRV